MDVDMVFQISGFGSSDYWIWFFWITGFGSSGLTGFGSSGLLDLVLRTYWIWFFGLLDLVLRTYWIWFFRSYWIFGFLRLDIVAIINDDTKIVNKNAGL